MADLLTSIRAEIDARLRELQPAIAEHERLSTAVDALVEEGRAISRPAKRAAPRPAKRAVSRPGHTPVRAPAKATARAKAVRRARKREQPTHTPTGRAILAALEHGSHTLAELVTVTALRASDIRESLRYLRTGKAIVKTDRDGKAAYALPSPEAE
jgi:hypothetical protein